MDQQLTNQEYRHSENAKLVYILYLVSLIFGITAIIGVVILYINKDEKMPKWLKSHYDFLINTFWKGMIILVVGIITSIFIVGVFLLIFFAVWVIIRCVKGMKRLDLQEEQPNPTEWMFD